MRLARIVIDTVADALLPRTTAAAVCMEKFVETRCSCSVCSANCVHGGKQQRVCQYCNGVKRCGGWLCAGTCAKNCNPC
jgi:hypothetical protein